MNRNKIAAILLTVLGVAIGVIGLVGRIAPPIITALGFFVIAWVFFGRSDA